MHPRELTPDDREAAWRLGLEAFGGAPGDTLPAAGPHHWDGRRDWGTFDGDRLVAKAVGFDLASWFRGAPVPTCGIAGVAVAAEHRGQGLLAPLLGEVLRRAAGDGAVVSTLYPTATGIYRSCGYEVIASYDVVELALGELRGLPATQGVATRRATVDDAVAVHAVYEGWARAQSGPLTRTGPRFPATPDRFDHLTGVTLATRGGRVTGVLAWRRGRGYDPATAVLSVEDLLAVDADSYRALWRVVASFASVVGRVRLTTSGDDPARLVLPTSAWNVVDRHPYMLRVLDVAAALAGPGGARLPVVPRTRVSLDLAVAGDRYGVLDGRYRLTLDDAGTRCDPVPTSSEPVPTLTPQGLALAYAGAQTCANLRLLDHLTGPAEHDDLLDAVLAGPPRHVRDYF